MRSGKSRGREKRKRKEQKVPKKENLKKTVSKKIGKATFFCPPSKPGVVVPLLPS